MAEIPFLVKDLALILMVAGVVTLIFKRLKQPLVLGYIVAGFLVSPHMPYTVSVMDETDIQTWADIGVIFTLFSLGLDFSFKKNREDGCLARHRLHRHRFLHDDAGHQRGPRIRMGPDGLHLPGRYARHELYHHYI